MNEQVYIFPTSFAEQRLWFLHQLAPDNPVYNLHSATRLTYKPDLVTLRDALNEIVRRHESLRTTFKAVNGEPVQVVAASLNLALPVLDLRELPEAEREEEALRIAAEEARRPFDLEDGPLLRVSLLRLGENDYIFLLTIHHIVCDFWSMDVFVRELALIYEAFCARQPSPLRDLPIQYADFAEWEWQWLEEDEGKSSLDYWKKQLAELPMLRMPTDWPRPAVQSFRGSVYSFWIPTKICNALRDLSQKEGVTLFMTLLAAFQTLLHRYTGQDDVAVGTPVANRHRSELEGLIGFFVNTLVLRTDLSGNPTFRELIARVQRMAFDAYEHQRVPFEKLVRVLRPERDTGHNPLFQVHFQLLSDMGSSEEPGPIDGTDLGVEREAAIFDLALDIWEYEDGLEGVLEYSTDLFSGASIARMVKHFQTLLKGVVKDPDQSLSDLPLLTTPERQKIVKDWNDTLAPYPNGRCLHELFESRVEQTPDAIAVSLRSETLTYDVLNRRANQLAHYLKAGGVRPDQIVALCAERSLELVIGILGILKAGGAYLPLDPLLPKDRLRFMMQDVQPWMLLTQHRFAQDIRTSSIDCLCLDTDLQQTASYGETNPSCEVQPQNLAYVIYTSGSTGLPKGVLIPQKAVCNHLHWMLTAFPVSGADRIPQKYPFSFDAAVCETFYALLGGAQLIMTEPSEYWDAPEFIEFLTDQQITVLDLVPSMLQVLLEDNRFAACRSIRRVICGGEPLSTMLRDQFFAQLDAELVNIYGPTEATIGSTSWTCQPGDTDQIVPIGKPISNTQVYLLDSYRKLVPIGVPGELYIGGEGLARGYINRPDLTAERFILDPISGKKGGRLYKTGDLARYLPDGNIEFLGRIDEQVKVRGFRVELGEIESVIARHPSVQTCKVLVREEEPDQTKLVAYVVPAADTPELWPSVGEYGIYDEVMYYAMTHDEGRNRSYRVAIDQTVKGKKVLDIGTGADAILARLCVNGGAERVYAVEVSEPAYRSAQQLVHRLGLADNVVLIHGDSTKIELPEKVDVCVSELLGMIGSSEGVTPILNDARRFLKDDGVMIPQRCVTRVAPICLPEDLAQHPKLTEIPHLYVEKVFEKVGHPFDLRMCIKNFPPTNLLSAAQVFEDLNFASHIEPEYDFTVTFTINKNSRLDGFLLWLNLYLTEQEVIDSLNYRHNWLPVFFPAFCPGVEVSEGDVIEAVCSCRISTDTRMPDFRISGTLRVKGAEPTAFDYSSPHRTRAFKSSVFYEALFDRLNGHMASWQPSDQPITQKRNSDDLPQISPTGSESGLGLVPTLRRFLREQLPEYMIPSAFMVLGNLPRTPSGKLDRRALPMPGGEWPQSKDAYVPPSTELEQTIVNVWQEVLNLEHFGIHDNFFDLGGDSLLISRVRSKLAASSNKELSIVDLFRYPTVNSLAQFMSQEDAQTDPFLAAQERARKQLAAVGELKRRMA
jgi:amino acid adenylation domain-containing protein